MFRPENIDEEHSVLVDALVKPPQEILMKISADKIDLVHAALGIAGEAGELVDAIKKHAIYNTELDLENVIEELGDLEFYMEQLRSRLGIHRSATLEANIMKLRIRYAQGYSDSAAQERADKL